MTDRKLRFAPTRLALPLLLALAVLAAACGSSGDDANGFAGDAGGDDGGAISDATIPPFGGDGGGGGDATHGFDVQPSALQTITVTAGQTTPTVAFTATLDGAPVNAAWTIDRGDVGSVAPSPASAATFTPKGTSGGLVTITAGVNGQTQTRQVFVKIVATQNGANAGDPSEGAQIPSGPGDIGKGGGVGGVGGEGLGGPVSDPGLTGALGAPAGDGKAQSLAMLYPYDATVWPRGMLAPLLMWSWTTGDADAIQIELATTSGSYSYKGTFGRPAVLAQTGGAFIRHPIPQDVWNAATNTAGGPTPGGAPDKLTLKLTVAKGTTAYGPITQTWAVAPARLTGTVYYNSYGTQLVKNWVNTDKAGHVVGAAILGVRSGDLGPKLVVGQDSPLNASGVPTDDTGCRVCHVVSSRGRWLVTQSEQGTPGDSLSFLYDLQTSSVQTMTDQGVFAWAAMTSDGAYALTNVINPSSSNPAITNSSNGNATSSFWQFGASPVAATTTGLPANVGAGYPSYSPDDKMIAYADVTGSTQDVKGPLVIADYASATHTFANVRTAFTPAAGQRAGYPVFLPDDQGLLFELELRSSQSDTVMVTRNGARSELWWVNLSGTPQPRRLDALVGRAGGASYLPVLPNNHGIAGASDPQSSYDETGQDDTTLDYEPTVLPIVEGGYAWVVFTSRRAYGNMLTAVPWQSWPPNYDTTDVKQGATKKLWVAAIDLNAPPGTDPSHPAFYLPAQEILAGNSRGFWVLDPCKADGQTCETGDQCCNGYCEPNGDGGALVCSNVPPSSNCSGPQEKCSASSDCCDPSNQCINGFCAEQVH